MQHEITRHSLENGAELLLINVPNSISFYFGSYIRNGHRFCNPAQYEVPHLLEHLAFEGNKAYPEPLQFKSAIEGLGAGYNALTGNDRTSYYFVAGPEHLSTIINIGIDQIFEPLIKDGRVNQQKQVITQELVRYIDDDRANNDYRHTHELFPALCIPFEDRADILQHISPDDVRRYHAKTYGVANTFFVLSGTFNQDCKKQVIEQLNSRLKNYPRGEQKKYLLMPMSDNLGSVIAYDSKIPTQNHFYLSFSQPGVNRNLLTGLKMLVTIFGIGLGSRMVIKSREAGLTYSFRTGVASNNDRTSLVMWDQTSPDKIEPLVKLGIKELVEIASGNFSEEEFERAKGLMVGTLKRSLQTPAALAGWYDNQILYGWPLESPHERIRSFEEASIESVKKAAAEYVKSDNWLLTMIGQNLEVEQKEYTDIINSYFA